MQSIPIVVSRLTESGRKEVYTVRDSMVSSQNQRNEYRPGGQFATLDNFKEKQNKVRIRRIQSSGSKRKFPKDFFSRQSHRPNKNTSMKQSKTIEHLAKDTGCFVAVVQPCFATVAQHDNSYPGQQQSLETPKFHSKNQLQLYKNQTLKQTLHNFISKKQKTQRVQIPSNKNIQKKQIISFQNTFSGCQLRSINQECIEIELNAILKPQSENVPVKRIKGSKQNFMKKFSLMKDKPGFVKYKNSKG